MLEGNNEKGILQRAEGQRVTDRRAYPIDCRANATLAAGYAQLPHARLDRPALEYLPRWRH